MENKSKVRAKAELIDKANKPVYEPPEITVYTSEQIMEQIGPAGACSANQFDCAG